MKMSAGYMQVDVGVIPEDWICVSVEQLVLENALAKPLDGNHGNIHPKSGDFVSSGIPFVMANNVKNGRLDLANCSFIRKAQAANLQKGFARTGDVLLTHKATIGQTAIVGDLDDEYIMLTPQVTYYRVVDGSRLSNRYLQQYFESAGFQRVLLSLSGGGTRSYIGITAQLRLPIVVPPYEEQCAIAAALSDVDALLAKLDALIAKKRDLKQAAMQQLLTGQTRLPGFSGEWEVKRLHEVVDQIDDGATPATSNPTNFGGSIAWVVIDDIRDEIRSTSSTLTEQGLSSCAAKLWPPGTLILSTGATIGEVGIAKIPVATKQGICGLMFKPERAIPTYMKSWFKLNKSLLLAKAQGSSIKEVRVPTLVQFHIKLPSVSEQAAIATVLSDTDAELAALEFRRDKTRALKQGMMQKLLTGKIRLL